MAATPQSPSSTNGNGTMSPPASPRRERTEDNGVPNQKQRRLSLGVQVTGYMEMKYPKKTFGSERWKRRFFVLTNDAFHCFKREEEDSSLFGDARDTAALNHITDCKVVVEDKKMFQFKSTVNQKIWTMRCPDEEQATNWQRAIEEAIHEYNKRKDAERKTGRLKRSSISGDFRNKQKYWPLIQSLSAGEVKEVEGKPIPVPVIKRGLAWGETVDLGVMSSNSTVIVRFPESRSLQLNPDDLSRAIGHAASAGEMAPGKTVEDLISVKNNSPSSPGGGKQWAVRLRWQSQLRERKVAWQHIPLPVTLILVSTLVLFSSEFGTDWRLICVWFLACCMAGTVLFKNLRPLYKGRHVRVWNITLLSWERETTRAQDANEADTPERYINAEKGDRHKGFLRWQATLEWRRVNNVDTILEMPHKKFDVIKKYYPHFSHKRCMKGYPIYIEKLGGINMEALIAAEVTIEDLLYHYIFITEYLWEVVDPTPTARVLTILDAKGIGLTNARGKAMDFVKKASKMIATHYPERSYKIFVINVPSWFNILWAMVLPFIDKTTREKITIKASDYKADLLKVIEPDQLPVEYGGTCTCGREGGEEGHCRFMSEDELGMKELAAKCNEETKEGKEQLRQVTQRRKSQASLGTAATAATVTNGTSSSSSSSSNPRGRPVARDARR